MIIKTDAFKKIGATILAAIDNSEISTLTETLELKTVGRTLYLNTTNGEYYVSVTFPLDHDEDFHATVNANLFLKLLAATTSEDIELTIKDTYVLVKGNGTYKLPLIFEGDHLLELPKICLENKTLEMKIGGAILESIDNYNSKELLRGTISHPVQKMYYMDEQGCITFTTGACINNFQLEKPIRVLLSNRIVKLFKLFKNDMVDFALGYDPITEDLIQTKVSLSTPNIKLVAITGCTDDLLNAVPVAAIRARGAADYKYSLVISTEALKQSISRLLLFSAGKGVSKNVKPYSMFKYDPATNVLNDSDANQENQEGVHIENRPSLKSVLDTVTDKYITFEFGNHKAVAIKRQAITNIIPECKSK